MFVLKDIVDVKLLLEIVWEHTSINRKPSARIAQSVARFVSQLATCTYFYENLKRVFC